MDQVDVKWEK